MITRKVSAEPLIKLIGIVYYSTLESINSCTARLREKATTNVQTLQVIQCILIGLVFEIAPMNPHQSNRRIFANRAKKKRLMAKAMMPPIAIAVSIPTNTPTPPVSAENNGTNPAS